MDRSHSLAWINGDVFHGSVPRARLDQRGRSPWIGFSRSPASTLPAGIRPSPGRIHPPLVEILGEPVGGAAPVVAAGAVVEPPHEGVHDLDVARQVEDVPDPHREGPAPEGLLPGERLEGQVDEIDLDGGEGDARLAPSRPVVTDARARAPRRPRYAPALVEEEMLPLHGAFPASRLAPA
jgi:hypothetical protein